MPKIAVSSRPISVPRMTGAPLCALKSCTEPEPRAAREPRHDPDTTTQEKAHYPIPVAAADQRLPELRDKSRMVPVSGYAL